MRAVLLPACSLSLLPFGHHQDLHSFPTRRSSDLARAWASGVLPVPCSQRLVLSKQNASSAVCQAPATPSRDRKSTRLNSSHLGISYAVFCLKKKNTEDIHACFIHIRFT